jgi:hypothetical protein
MSDTKNAKTTKKTRARKPLVSASKLLTQMKRTMRANAKKAGMSKDELDKHLEKLETEVIGLDMHLSFSKQDKVVEVCKELDKLRDDFVAAVEKTGTDLTPAEVLKMPAYYNYQDNEKKQHKARDENADWLKQQLAGKNKDQRQKILDAHQQTADKTRGEFFESYITKSIKRREDAKQEKKILKAFDWLSMPEAPNSNIGTIGGLEIDTYGIDSWAFNASLLGKGNMTLERVEQYKRFFPIWHEYLSARIAAGKPHPHDFNDFIESEQGAQWRDFLKTEAGERDVSPALDVGKVVSISSSPMAPVSNTTKKKAAKKKVTKKKNP